MTIDPEKHRLKTVLRLVRLIVKLRSLERRDVARSIRPRRRWQRIRR